MVKKFKLTVRTVFEVKDCLSVLVLWAIDVNCSFGTDVVALLGFTNARNYQRHVHIWRA